MILKFQISRGRPPLISRLGRRVPRLPLSTPMLTGGRAVKCIARCFYPFNALENLTIHTAYCYLLIRESLDFDLTRARPGGGGGGVSAPARSAAKFAIAVQPIIWHIKKKRWPDDPKVTPPGHIKWPSLRLDFFKVWEPVKDTSKIQTLWNSQGAIRI